MSAALKVSNPMYDRTSAETINETVSIGGGQTAGQKLSKYEEIFRRYDVDGSGTIEAAELGEVMKDLGQEVSPAELRKMIEAIDADGSGEIDFEEFMQAVNGKMSAVFADMNKQLEEEVFGTEVRPQR